MRASQEGSVGTALLLSVERVGSAIAAHVQYEHIELAAIRNVAIHTLGLGQVVPPHRRILEECARRACGQRLDALLRVAIVEHLAVRPVVGHFVVVPLPDLRNFGAEALQVRVVAVVEVIAAEFLQRLGHLQFLRHDVEEGVGPDELAGRVRHAFLQRRVGVDRVAGMQEEVRPRASHRFVDLHAAKAEIDPPALADGVARPDEADLAAFCRRRAQAPDDGLAARLAGIEILEGHAHEHVALVRQPREIETRREVCGIEGVRAAQDDGVREVLVARPLDEHARRLIGATPDDRAIADHVADLQTPRRHRPQRIGRDDCRCLPGIENAADAGQRDAACKSVLDESTTACLHGILLGCCEQHRRERCHPGEGGVKVSLWQAAQIAGANPSAERVHVAPVAGRVSRAAAGPCDRATHAAPGRCAARLPLRARSKPAAPARARATCATR